MTKDQAKEYVYSVLDAERKKGHSIRKIDEQIEYQRRRSYPKGITYSDEKTQGGEVIDVFMESTHKIIELETERREYTTPAPEFINLLGELDPLEYSVVFAYYANSKSFGDIAQSYTNANMNAPSVHTLRSIKRRAIQKMIKKV
jgi:hypothetical protein